MCDSIRVEEFPEDYRESEEYLSEYEDDLLGPDLDYFEPESLRDDVDADRPIDQIHCEGCGRPMIVWADVPLKESDLTCARCKQGLAPEWEY